jgi:hypothetical protein
MMLIDSIILMSESTIRIKAVQVISCVFHRSKGQEKMVSTNDYYWKRNIQGHFHAIRY